MESRQLATLHAVYAQQAGVSLAAHQTTASPQSILLRKSEVARQASRSDWKQEDTSSLNEWKQTRAAA